MGRRPPTDARWKWSSADSSSSRCEEAYRASQRDKNGVCVLQSSERVHANAERGLQSSERVHANAERGLQSGERVHANAERGLQSGERVHANAGRGLQSGERVHANAERAEQNFSNPLLQVPPARRGNRAFLVPLAKRGNRTPTWFPSRSGGNLKEGGNINRISVIGSPRGSL
jgi:head-tail adaptor